MHSRDIFVRDPRIRTLERPDAEKDCGSAGRGEMGRGNVLQYWADAPTSTSIRILRMSMHVCTCTCICAIAMRLRMLVFCWWCARFCRIFIRDTRVGNQHAERSRCFCIFRPYFIFKFPWRIFCRSRSYVLNASAIRARTTSSFFSPGTSG